MPGAATRGADILNVLTRALWTKRAAGLLSSSLQEIARCAFFDQENAVGRLKLGALSFTPA
jgi:hypothetical protein